MITKLFQTLFVKLQLQISVNTKYNLYWLCYNLNWFQFGALSKQLLTDHVLKFYSFLLNLVLSQKVIDNKTPNFSSATTFFKNDLAIDKSESFFTILTNFTETSWKFNNYLFDLIYKTKLFYFISNQKYFKYFFKSKKIRL